MGACVSSRASGSLFVEPGPRAAGTDIEMRFVASIIATLLIGACAGGPLPSQVGAPGSAATSGPAADWQVVEAHDLAIPIPAGWKKTIDAPGNSDVPQPDFPWILYLADPNAPRSAARYLSIWIWPSTSVEQLVRDRYVQGNMSLVSEGTVATPRPLREVVGVASWSDSGMSGQYRARHLFLQVDAGRVVDVIAFGPTVPSSVSDPTSEMRSIQETVISGIVAKASTASANCPRSRARDGQGVITSDGSTGILPDTYMSASDMNASFLMLRRSTVLGQRVAVEFRQIGSSAPASKVWYSVSAEHPVSVPHSGWSDLGFSLGVKPIAFENSCWRLLVDGIDTGLVLFIGP